MSEPIIVCEHEDDLTGLHVRLLLEITHVISLTKQFKRNGEWFPFEKHASMRFHSVDAIEVGLALISASVEVARARQDRQHAKEAYDPSSRRARIARRREAQKDRA